MSYPGKPLTSTAGRPQKTELLTAFPSAGRGEGVADPRIVAEDSGPKKPGNRVEEKTLTTEKPDRAGSDVPTAPTERGKPWTKGEDDDVGEPM